MYDGSIWITDDWNTIEQYYDSEIETFNALHQQKLEILKTVIGNTKFPLNVRWELYRKAVSSGYLNNVSPWIEEFEELETNNLSYFGELGYSKYETVNLPELVSSCELEKFEGVEIDKLKEQILSLGYSDINLDW